MESSGFIIIVAHRSDGTSRSRKSWSAGCWGSLSGTQASPWKIPPRRANKSTTIRPRNDTSTTIAGEELPGERGRNVTGYLKESPKRNNCARIVLKNHTHGRTRVQRARAKICWVCWKCGPTRGAFASGYDAYRHMANKPHGPCGTLWNASLNSGIPKGYCTALHARWTLHQEKKKGFKKLIY